MDCRRDDGGQSPLVNWHLPQLGAQGSDLVVGQPGMAAERVPNRATHGADRRAVVLHSAAEPVTHVLGP